MKIINEKYKIIKEISVTSNSISYLVQNIIDKKRYIVKFLNRNVINEFPLDFFKKEYIINKLYVHPLIKNFVSFEKLYDIDGELFSSEEYFYVSNYYEACDPNELKDKKELFFNHFINVLLFLHKNKICHGDIKYNNTIFTTDNYLKLFDISPFFDFIIGKNDDLSKLPTLFENINICNIPVKNDINDYLSHELINFKIHIDILHKHFLDSPLPIFLTISEDEIKEILNIKSVTINFFNLSNIENAKIFTKNILPYFEINDYSILDLKINNKYFFTIGEKLIEYLWNFERCKKIITSYGNEYVKIYKKLPFTPSNFFIDTQAENKKLIEFTLYLLEEYCKLNPTILIIEDYNLLDEMSKEFINIVNKRFDSKIIKIIINNNLEIDNFYNYKVINLNYQNYLKLIDYYFYFLNYDKNLIKKIYEITNGEYYLIKEGFRNIGKYESLIIEKNKIYLTKDINVLFDFYTEVNNVLSSLNLEENYALQIITLFDNSLPEKIYTKLGKKFINSIESLIKKDLIMKYYDELKIKYNFILSKIEISPNNIFLKNTAATIEKFLEENLNYINTYQKIQFILENYNDSFRILWKIFKYYYDRNYFSELRVFVNIIKEYYKIEEKISNENKFDLYFIYLEMVSHIDNVDEILEKMDKYKKNVLDEFYKLYFDLQYTNSIDTIKKSYIVFEKFEYPDEIVWHQIVNQLLVTLSRLGYYDEAINLYNEKILPVLEKFSIYSKVKILINIYVIYKNKKDLENATKIAKEFIDILESNIDKISDDLKFSIYNNYANTLYQNNEKEKSLFYYNKAIEIAEKIKDNSSLATIYNNLGIRCYANNEVELGIEYLNKALKCATLCNEYDLKFLIIDNLGLEYVDRLEISKILSLLNNSCDEIKLLKTERQKNKIYLRYSKLFYILGDFDNSINYLNKCSHYFETDFKKMSISAEYFSLKVVFEIINKNEKAGINYIKYIFDKYRFEENKKDFYLFFLKTSELLFFSGFTKALKWILEIFNDPKNNYEGEDDFDKNLINILKYFFDLVDENIILVNFKNFSNLFKLYFLFAFFLKDRKKDIYFYEMLLIYYTLLRKFFLDVLPDYKENFINKSLFLKTFLKIFNKYKIDFFNFDIKKFIKDKKHIVDKYLQNSEKSFFSNQTLTPLIRNEVFIGKILENVLALTGLSRGIYFEYDTEKKWIKKEEKINDFLFKENENVQFSVIDEIVISKKDEIKEWKNDDLETVNSISYAMAFSVVDISLIRNVKNKSNIDSSSYYNLFSIKGVFYFDTKYKLLIPKKENLYYLFYLREYINVTFYYNKMKDSTLLDNLTKLYKREHWLNLAKDKLNYAKENNKKLCIVLSDIDYFKSINDNYGHKQGDIVLASIAEKVMKFCRINDIIGRYGGEEFIYCFFDANGEKGLEITERIRKSIENASILPDKKITVSFGIACYPDDGVLLNELIEKADLALLEAKEKGRNRSILWNNEKLFDSKAELLPSECKIINNPSREKWKIDSIINILEHIDYSHNSLNSILKNIKLTFQNELRVDNIYLVLRINNIFSIYSTEENEKINFNYIDFPEKLDDNTYRIAFNEFKLRNLEMALYFSFPIDSIKFHLENKFFNLIGKIILEKIALYRSQI